MHNFVIWSLDLSIFGFEVAWWHSKTKLLSRPQRFPFQKKTSFEVLQSDKVVLVLCVVYDQGFLFVVIRTSLGLSIRFYCRKIRNCSSFQKWCSKSWQNFSRFYYFWELQWSVLDSENFLDYHSVSSMPSKLLHGTIALEKGDLEYLKWL